MTGITAAGRGRVYPARLPASFHNGLWALFPAVLMAYATIVPQEVRFDLAGQNIYPARVVIFLLLPWILARIARGHYPFRRADLLMFIASGWMVLSIAMFYGPAEGILRGGALALDVVGPYLVARLSIRSLTDLRRLLVLMAPGVFLAGLSMMIESITQTQIVSPLAAKVFGVLPTYADGAATGMERSFVNFRYGLLRAAGPFAHPIAGGLFLASLLPLYFSSGLRNWPRKMGLAAGAMAIFSVSSAAILSMLIFAVLTAYDRLQRFVAFASWRVFLVLASILLLVVELGSQNGLVSIISRYTFNPGTASFRLLIWEYGTQSIARNPLWGIAFTDYERASWMSNSIDNHWLLLGVRHGLVVPVALLTLSIVTICRVSMASNQHGETDRRLYVGIAIAVFALTLSGFTVAFFGGLLTWFVLLLGIGISVAGDSRSVPQAAVQRIPAA